MKKANISKIKAELSKFIRLAKRGEEVVIMDRDQPVAKIVGIAPASAIHVEAAKSDLRALLKLSDQRAFDQTIDILDVLTQDRQDRLE